MLSWGIDFAQVVLRRKNLNKLGERGMNKGTIMLVGAGLCAGLLSGCVSSKSVNVAEERKNELTAFIIDSKKAESIPKTNDKSIDALSENSTIIYKRCGTELREYILKSRGRQNVIEMAYYLNTTRNPSDKEKLAKAEGIIKQNNTSAEKETPEQLIADAKEQSVYDAFLAYEEAEDKVIYKKNLSDAEKTEIANGKLIHQKRWGKTNFKAKFKDLSKLLDDSKKIGKNLAVVTNELANKASKETKELMALAKTPEMQNFIKETALIKTKKLWANDAKKKELDAQIDAIMKKTEYKPVMDKKAAIEAELKILSKNSGILADGVGTQIKFSAKALPWVIGQYMDMQNYGKEE